jgi:putative ubiquitin-RnfH superfamily antitoxin RatB of RatAB toxin-antitoxin module
VAAAAQRDIRVEVVYADPATQRLVAVTLPANAKVGDAIAAAREADATFPEVPAELDVGIWGSVSCRDRALADGDRVEIYRPLKLDPREARRRYAAAGLTMANHAGVKVGD